MRIGRCDAPTNRDIRGPRSAVARTAYVATLFLPAPRAPPPNQGVAAQPKACHVDPTWKIHLGVENLRLHVESLRLLATAPI